MADTCPPLLQTPETGMRRYDALILLKWGEGHLPRLVVVSRISPYVHGWPLESKDRGSRGVPCKNAKTGI